MLVLIVALACGAPAAPARDAAVPEAQRTAELPGWLEGAWVSTAENGTETRETWSPGVDGVMHGVSRTTGADGAPLEAEALRIEASPEGLTYVALPNGAATETRFRQASGNDLVFEDPTHDFPQRVRYYRDAGKLVAEVSTLDGSRSVSWTFVRDAR